MIDQLDEEEIKLLHAIQSKITDTSDSSLQLWAYHTAIKCNKPEWYEPLLIGAKYIILINKLKEWSDT